MCVCIVDKLRAIHQLVQADLDVEKELQANLIQAIQSLRPTDFLIMQLEDKLLTQQAASSSLSVSQQRGLDVLNGMLKATVCKKNLINFVHMYVVLVQLSGLGLWLLLKLVFKQAVTM